MRSSTTSIIKAARKVPRHNKRWSPREIAVLRRAVERHGKSNWKSISKHLEQKGFSGRSNVDVKVGLFVYRGTQSEQSLLLIQHFYSY